MKILLISPPFTQLNSPYASLPYLKGLLESNGIQCNVLDLGIQISDVLFSKTGLNILTDRALEQDVKSDDIKFFLKNSQEYISIIDGITDILKGKSSETELIVEKNRFPIWKNSKRALDKLINSGKNEADVILYKASLILDDIFLFYSSLCPSYELSKYSEKISLSPSEFKTVEREVLKSDDLISELIYSEMNKYDLSEYDIAGITIPFPGTLNGALKIGSYIKNKYPQIKIVLGGGYVNTELRQLSDPGIFKYTDYICIDDGEKPLLSICEYVEGKRKLKDIVRTFYCDNGKVVISTGKENDIEFKRGTPDYSGIDTGLYMSVTESLNPMLRLWSLNDTLKLRLSNGCYWHRCSFCDTSLPYIRSFMKENTDDIINDILKMISQTGIRRFHFVDEALPPVLMRDISIELIKQNIKISWWGNIRFDPGFTRDVCRLLKRAGCIAVVGGLESGSEKTLKRMNKGISVSQAVKVMNNFSSAGVLVHSYMIYAFPGETPDDLIDSAEVLRQCFDEGILDSAYWHRFSLTVHSGVFSEPEKFGIVPTDLSVKPFANNDTPYTGGTSNKIDDMGPELKKAVYNWMNDNLTGNDIRSWFDVRVPSAGVQSSFVRNNISELLPVSVSKGKFVWLGGNTELKGHSIIVIHGERDKIEYELPRTLAEWLKNIISKTSVFKGRSLSLKEAGRSFPDDCGIKFSEFLTNEIMDDLNDAGLLII